MLQTYDDPYRTKYFFSFNLGTHDAHHLTSKKMIDLKIVFHILPTKSKG
jgi:hypothetical protein